MGAESVDFWLLTAVCEAPAPVSWLAAMNRDEVFNLPVLGCTGRELVASLERLVAAELIYIERVSNPLGGQSAEAMRARLAPSRSQFVDHLTEEARIGRFSHYYGLTAKGGERWETLARPEWNRFVNRWSDPSTGQGEITAQERFLAERWMEALPYLSQGTTITSITRRVIEPWQATYWKSLPRGFEVTYQIHGGESSRYEVLPGWVQDLQTDASDWYSWTGT